MNGHYRNLWQYSQACRPGVQPHDLPAFNPLKVEEMSHGPNFGFVSYEADRIAFAFQGSVNVGDWAEDLRGVADLIGDLLLITDFQGTDVYPGFKMAFDPFRDRIAEVAKTYSLQLAQNGQSPRFVCAGHSLGSTLACQCAELLHDLGFTDVEGVGFGCPHVYNQQGAAAFGAKKIDWTRIKNGNDIVTTLPPIVCVPVGTEIVIPESEVEWPWVVVEQHVQYQAALEKAGI